MSRMPVNFPRWRRTLDSTLPSLIHSYIIDRLMPNKRRESPGRKNSGFTSVVATERSRSMPSLLQELCPTSTFPLRAQRSGGVAEILLVLNAVNSPFTATLLSSGNLPESRPVADGYDMFALDRGDLLQSQHRLLIQGLSVVSRFIQDLPDRFFDQLL